MKKNIFIKFLSKISTNGLTLLLVLSLLLMLSGVGYSQQEIDQLSLVIMHTNDIHARLDNFNYLSLKEESGSLAQVYTLVKQIREENEFTLLLDAGDFIEGSSTVTPAHLGQDPLAPHPVAKVMRMMGFDATCAGNHEFNFPIDVLNKIVREVGFPVLSANVLNAAGYPYFIPYVLKRVGPVTVGILGATTPIVATVEPYENIPDLTFADPVEMAKKYVPEMKEAGADVIIILQHSGWEKRPDEREAVGEVWMDLADWADTTEEYAFALRLAQVPGVDVVLSGHSHVNIPQALVPTTTTGNVLVQESSCHGKVLGQVAITLEKLDNKWVITGKSGTNVSTSKVDVAPEIIEAVKYYHDQTVAFNSIPIIEARETMVGGLQAKFHDDPLTEFIGDAMLWYVATQSGRSCDIAAAFCTGNDSFILEAGPVTVGHLAALHPWSNTIQMLELTGADLKAALEHMYASFKNYTGEEQSLEEFNPGVFLSWQGAEFRVDLTNPAGARIVDFKCKGIDVKPDQLYTICMENYTAGGGHDFTWFRDSELLWGSLEYIPNILVEYIKAHPGKEVLTSEVDNNWAMIQDLSGLIEKWTKSRLEALESGE